MKLLGRIPLSVLYLIGIMAGVAILIGAYGSFAADLSTKDRPNDTIALPNVPNVLPPGFYVGIGIGAELTDSKTSVPGASVDLNFAGFLGDVCLGYDFKMGIWRTGPRGCVSFEDVKGGISSGGTSINGQQTFGYELGWRVGPVIDKNLYYVGIAYQGQHVGMNNTGFSTDLSGLKLYGGLEHAITDRLTLGLEGAWVDYSTFNVTGNALTVDQTGFRATARASYHW